jgi:hypothetical protein
MKRFAVAMSVMFLFLSVSGTEARISQSPATSTFQLTPQPMSKSPAGLIPQTMTRIDTVYFGGDDGNGIGFEGGIWDFDNIATDPQMGWTSTNLNQLIGIVDEDTYTDWLLAAGLGGVWPLSGNALENVDQENSPFWPPGIPVGHYDRLISGTVHHDGYDSDDIAATILNWDHYAYFALSHGTFYRPGYQYYPHTSEQDPDPHWSSRMGQSTWYYTGDAPICNDEVLNLTTLNGVAGDPLPADWDSVKMVYEIWCSASAFGMPPTPDEGNTFGSPIIDNARVGIVNELAMMTVYPQMGWMWHDGFGQENPQWLDPCDVGNSNITFNHATFMPDANAWLADSCTFSGPMPVEGDSSTRWLMDLCFKIKRLGPKQNLIPAYYDWTSRLDGDPTVDFVCVTMDSVESYGSPSLNKFATYFHESDPGFDSSAADLSEANEILPDLVFTPGTQIEYYYRSYYVDEPGQFNNIPPNPVEFEILPGMYEGEDGYIVWPSVLYIDAYNRGAEQTVVPVLEQLGIEFDKYDYLETSSGWSASMRRTLSFTGPYNPGGYGNNGCTVDQLLGYRLILFDLGTFGAGVLERDDAVLFTEWLDNNGWDTPSYRRGFSMSGCGVAVALNDNNIAPEGRDFLNYRLGAQFVHDSYGDKNLDSDYCVCLDNAASSPITYPELALYGNGHPAYYAYDVINWQPGVDGTLGSMIYTDCADGSGSSPTVEFAQVIRSNLDYPSNWRSAISGFGLHQMATPLPGDPCPTDPASVSGAAGDLVSGMLEWVFQGDDMPEPGRYGPVTNCSSAVDDDTVTHIDGAGNYLFGSTPNPFSRRATIRFQLANTGQVDIDVYDVSGRRIHTLSDGLLEGGQEHTLIWDGTDTHGAPVGGGVYWIQMRTASGFESSKRMVVMR